jgi:ABC-type transporter Mla subunit MlaD
MHVALDPPVGEPPSGRLEPGATLRLNQSSTYPSTEQTLSSLSVVINSGGVGQIGDIIHNFNAALSGRESSVRDLLTRLDKFVGMFDDQRDQIIATTEALNRLAGTLAGQRDVIARALRTMPAALDVLIRERPRITTALEKLRVFSNTATGLVNDVQADLVKNLQNLAPTMRALADVGPDLDTALAYAATFPYPQNFIDRVIRGDYYNVFAIADLTVARLKRTLFLGTRWGREGDPVVPAPGDPYWEYYSYDPLNLGIAPPPPDQGGPPDSAPPPGPPPGGVPAPPAAATPPSQGAPPPPPSQVPPMPGGN